MHGVSPATDRRRLAIALGLIVGFLCVEVVAGIVAHSVALLSDAAHMLTDAGAIGLSLVVLNLAQRPAAGRWTYGLKRAEVLSAQVNGLTLLLLGGALLWESVRRLFSPSEVDGGLMLVVALIGVAVNLLATWILARADRDNLNVEGAFQHLLTDLYAFIGTAIASVVILLTGFDRADSIAAIGVGVLMLRSAGGLLRASGRILMEGAPAGLDPVTIGPLLLAEPGVREVHDLHVWAISTSLPALSAHVLVGPDDDCHAVRRRLEAVLHERHGIEHTTLQVDHARPELLEIEDRTTPSR